MRSISSHSLAPAEVLATVGETGAEPRSRIRTRPTPAPSQTRSRAPRLRGSWTSSSSTISSGSPPASPGIRSRRFHPHLRRHAVVGRAGDLGERCARGRPRTAPGGAGRPLRSPPAAVLSGRRAHQHARPPRAAGGAGLRGQGGSRRGTSRPRPGINARAMQNSRVNPTAGVPFRGLFSTSPGIYAQAEGLTLRAAGGSDLHDLLLFLLEGRGDLADVAVVELLDLVQARGARRPD